MVVLIYTISQWRYSPCYVAFFRPDDRAAHDLTMQSDTLRTDENCRVKNQRNLRIRPYIVSTAVITDTESELKFGGRVKSLNKKYPLRIKSINEPGLYDLVIIIVQDLKIFFFFSSPKLDFWGYLSGPATELISRKTADCELWSSRFARDVRIPTRFPHIFRPDHTQKCVIIVVVV